MDTRAAVPPGYRAYGDYHDLGKGQRCSLVNRTYAARRSRGNKSQRRGIVKSQLCLNKLQGAHTEASRLRLVAWPGALPGSVLCGSPQNGGGKPQP